MNQMSRYKLALPEHEAKLRFAAIRSHQEVAKILGISEERVRQIERIALWKLRRNKELKIEWEDYKKTK